MKPSQLSIGINTNVFQHKLKAVAKHANALAEELDRIDRNTCDECGEAEMNETTLHVGDGKTEKILECTNCGEKWYAK